MGEAAAQEALRATGTDQHAEEIGPQRRAAVGAPIGQVPIRKGPDALVWVQLGRIGRQGLEVQAGEGSAEGPHERRIRFFDPEKRKWLVFLTNNFTLPAPTSAQLSKCRWQVELFCKWIQQHLRIKAVYGTSENTVKTQIWIALAVYVLVAIVKKRLHREASLYTILQILSVSLFEKIPLTQTLTLSRGAELEDDPGNQLNLFE